MVEEVFELYRAIAEARSRSPSGPDDLSETEFLALDTLHTQEPLTIGEVQKSVGVAPAQMSRIVRALEKRGGKGYISCEINAEDRRRIDLFLTESGREAHAKYRDARMRSIGNVLTVLAPDDRFEFMRMMRQLRDAFAKRVDQS
jgi:DNA-binding MarR family transcriptional regulator